MKRQAFTLIELLIVIGIIATLSAVVVFDFRGVRQSQVLNSTVQELDALVQQSRAEVRAGKSTAEWEWLCEGVALEVGQAPQKLEGQVDFESGKCQETSRSDYGLGSDAVRIQQIQVGEEILSGTTELWFVPPDGLAQIWQADVQLNAQLQVVLMLTANESATRTYSFDPAS